MSRVALVTGSAKRRIGWHIADMLAQRGFDIAVHYRTSERDALAAVERFESYGVRAASFPADLRNEGAARGLVDAAAARFGRLDLLVNCAADWKSKPLEEVTGADVRAMFELNTLATFLCCQQAGLVMTRQADGGSIVNFADWSIARPYPNYAAYFPSKGAIPTLTRMFAVELARRNPKVRVNCIAPGPVMVPEDVPAAERQEAIDSTLVKREGDPMQIAKAVWYLVENDFVTGTCLTVDGGRTIAE